MTALTDIVNSPGTQQNVRYTEVFTQEDRQGFDSHASSSECFHSTTEIPNWLAKFLWLLGLDSWVSF